MALVTKVKNKGKVDLEDRKDDDLGFGQSEFLRCGRLYFPDMIPDMTRNLMFRITCSYYNMILICPPPRDGVYVPSLPPAACQTWVGLGDCHDKYRI